MSRTTFTPDNTPDIMDKTLRELKSAMPETVSIQVFHRVDDDTGEHYTVAHARGEGAHLLHRMLLAFGVIKPGPQPHLVKGDSA